MDMDTPPQVQAQAVAPASTQTQIQTQAQTHEIRAAQVDFLASKLAAVAGHVMKITALPIEMRTVIILHRAIAEFKSRYVHFSSSFSTRFLV
jgi:hypothetical protein